MRNEPRNASLTGTLALLAAGALACLGYFAAEAWLLSFDLGFPLDDSWIHLQFARNLAEGRGLSYNPGELVTGSTAPLWTALLALLFYVPGGVIVGAKVLGVAFYLAGIDATRRLARELGLGPGLAALAAGLTLATSWLVWSALSGMEIPLFVFLSLWGMIFHLRERGDGRRPPLSFAVFAVAALARPEGLLLLVLAFVDRFLVFGHSEDPEPTLAWRRPDLKLLLAGAALAACALVGPILFYRWAGDSFLPTTFAAKGGELRRFLPNLQYVYTVVGIFFRPQPYMTLLAGAGVLALLERLGTRRDRGLLPALWLLALPLAYSTISPEGRGLIAGNFGRYYFPMFPVLILLGVLGLERTVAALGPRIGAGVGGHGGRWRRPAGALLLALLAWPTVSNLVQGAGRYAQNVANVQDSDVKMARWLAGRLPPEAVIAVNDIGALKFFLPNRVIDLAGIATPEVRREVDQSVAQGTAWETAVVNSIVARTPDYLVVFPEWFPGVVKRPEVFRPIYGVSIPNNITMGGEELVVYETPWTRHRLKDGKDSRDSKDASP